MRLSTLKSGLLAALAGLCTTGVAIAQDMGTLEIKGAPVANGTGFQPALQPGQSLDIQGCRYQSVRKDQAQNCDGQYFPHGIGLLPGLQGGPLLGNKAHGPHLGNFQRAHDFDGIRNISS